MSSLEDKRLHPDYSSKELSEIVVRAHNATHPDSHPLSYPDDPELSPSSPEGLALLTQRMASQQAFRELFEADISRQCEDRPLLLQTIRIFNHFAPTFNELFIEQMRNTGQPLPRSWEIDSPRLVDQLKQKYNQATTLFPMFFDQNTESAEILRLLTQVAPHVKTPAEMKTLVITLEKLALAGTQKGLPTISSLMADYYTLPNPDPNQTELYHLDADLRLVVPVEQQFKTEYDQFAHDQHQLERKIFARTQGKFKDVPHPPQTIISVCLLGAGQQLWSYTSAEAFVDQGLIINLNLFKTLPAIRHSLALCGQTSSDSDIIKHLLVIYTPHEIAHLFNQTHPRIIEEFLADAPMLIATFMKLHLPTTSRPEFTKDISPQIAIACLVGECATLAQTYTPTENDFNNGYALSARFILLQLLAHHLVQVTPDKLGYTIPSDPAVLRSNINKFVFRVNQYMIDILSRNDPNQSQFHSLENDFTPQLVDYHSLITLFSRLN